MKRWYLPILLLSMLYISCDEDSCESTSRDPISFSVQYNIIVGYEDNTMARDIPVEITFQKFWCDGDYSIIASYSGNTNDNGYYHGETGWQIELENDFDYEEITITINKGKGIEGNEMSDQKKVFYSDVTWQGKVNANKTFILPI